MKKFEVFCALVVTAAISFGFGDIATLCLISGWSFNEIFNTWSKKND